MLGLVHQRGGQVRFVHGTVHQDAAIGLGGRGAERFGVGRVRYGDHGGDAGGDPRRVHVALLGDQPPRALETFLPSLPGVVAEPVRRSAAEEVAIGVEIVEERRAAVPPVVTVQPSEPVPSWGVLREAGGGQRHRVRPGHHGRRPSAAPGIRTTSARSGARSGTRANPSAGSITPPSRTTTAIRKSMPARRAAEAAIAYR